MSFQWTLIAGFLYVEIFIVILLILPFIGCKRWQSLFRSRILQTFSSYSNLYFNVFIVILLIMFFDAVREMRKYSVPLETIDLKNSPYAESTAHMKLFRAQRNFYIAGFSLFLWLVLRRLVTLISTQATLEANVEASRKQAESATAVAQQMLDNNETSHGTTEDATRASLLEDKLANAQQDLTVTKDELDHTKVDLQMIKKQAEATNAEYDRLLSVNESLQKQLESLTADGAPECKKDN